MSDDIETRRKRAVWRAGHRGTKELDILVGTYAGAKLPEMADAALTRFEQFLAVTDPELQSWLLNPEPGVTGGDFADLVTDIRSFHGLATSPRHGEAMLRMDVGEVERGEAERG